MNVRADIAATLTDRRVTLDRFRPLSISPDATTPKRVAFTLDGDSLIRTSRGRSETVIESWLDWIDYWAVDFDFRGVFNSRWQDFRERRKRSLKFESPASDCGAIVMVQVIDVFANEHRKAIIA